LGEAIQSIIMDSQTNAFQLGMPTSDEFRWLLHRHRVLISQLRLASKDFGDLSDLPVDHVAAALVVQEASAELHALHDNLLEWYARQGSAPRAFAASAAAAAPRSPRVGLILKEYAPDNKVSVIRVLRESVPGCSLTKAKALVERQLPAPIADGLALEEAKAIRQKFEAVGAVCRISVMNFLSDSA
jgi:ribosomal protein L7/L12